MASESQNLRVSEYSDFVALLVDKGDPLLCFILPSPLSVELNTKQEETARDLRNRICAYEKEMDKQNDRLYNKLHETLELSPGVPIVLSAFCFMSVCLPHPRGRG